MGDEDRNRWSGYVDFNIHLDEINRAIQSANLPGSYTCQIEDDTISLNLENTGNVESHMDIIKNVLEMIYHKQGLREFTVLTENALEMDGEIDVEVDAFANCKMIQKIVGKAEKIKEEDPLVKGQCDCYICFDPYKPRELKRVLKCGHVFHKKCIDKWLKHKSSCPECRTDLLENVKLDEEDLRHYMANTNNVQYQSVMHIEITDEDEDENTKKEIPE